jgi:hypothetical protein
MKPIHINQSNQHREILRGFYCQWKDTDSKVYFRFQKLESFMIKQCPLNSGGDVFEGTTIYNTLKNFFSEIHIYIDGLLRRASLH